MLTPLAIGYGLLVAVTNPEGELLADRYRLMGTIGRGGMAQVLLAEDEKLGRRVAVKRLHVPGAEEPAARFDREARLGASLNHPNLVSVYDVSADGESVLIIMEYVEGSTLKDVLAEGPMDPLRVSAVVADVASALDEAHRNGVVHRDVKPANILLRHDGVTKLADLGIATAANSTKITGAGIVLGTASYMAPEQVDGAAAGPAADVYALAAVAYEALSGEKARQGASPMEVAHRVVGDPPPDLSRVRPDLPSAAANVLARGMARRPEERPPSAVALARELSEALRAEPAPTEPREAVALPAADGWADTDTDRSPPGLVTHRRGFPRWVPAAAALAVLAAAAAGGFALMGGDDGGPSGGAAAERAESRAPKRAERPSASAPTADPGRPAATADETQAGASGGAVPGRFADAGPDALNSEGHRLIGAGQPAAAIPLLERAVQTAPRGELIYAYSLFNLGRALRLAGRPGEAVPILERRLQIPDQREVVRAELERARAAAGR